MERMTGSLMGPEFILARSARIWRPLVQCTWPPDPDASRRQDKVGARSCGESPRLEDEARLEIEQCLLEADRIAVRIFEAFDAGVETRELRFAAGADLVERRRIVDALAAAVDRDEEVGIRRRAVE